MPASPQVNLTSAAAVIYHACVCCTHRQEEKKAPYTSSLWRHSETVFAFGHVNALIGILGTCIGNMHEHYACLVQ
jgi:hypothetical protein